jgi:hypothetical protein
MHAAKLDILQTIMNTNDGGLIFYPVEKQIGLMN